ncbi:MAG: hypothetical protein CL758_06330 [Chloroflexi bacterium]|nr:hypothetical protein [Chloroflexota bacterium]MBN19070.1 hypothetical protein [Chloroflexota bacterium]
MSRIWLWSVSPINWEVVKKEEIWGTQAGKGIQELIHSDDIFIFHVMGTNQIQGIYKTVDQWFDSKYQWPDGRSREYKHEIKLELIKSGVYPIFKQENVEKLEFFTNKEDIRKKQLKTRGNGGYPANDQNPISEKDYEEILNSMKDIGEQVETIKIEKEEDVREIIVDELEKDLIGPRYGSEEILPKDVTPMNTYFAGILFPQEIPDVEDEIVPGRNNNDEIIEGDTRQIKDGEENANTVLDQPIMDKDLTRPTSIGLTCMVSSNMKTVKISINWGVYDTVIIDNKNRYKREQKVFEKILELKEEETEQVIDEEKQFALKWKVRKNKEQFLISVYGINRLEFREKTRKKIYEYCIFQPKIKLTAEDEKENIFVDYSDEFEHIDPDDVNEMLFGLLFRKKRNFGIGHTCSVNWDVDSEKESVSWLETTFMPKYEFPVIKPKELELDCLEMERLGTISDIKQFRSELTPIADAYEEWITEKLRPKISTLETKLQRTAEKQVERCEDALRRIREGIEIISTDENAGDAFRFANLGMYYQRLYGGWAENNRRNGRVIGFKPKKPELKYEIPRWRPFQLVFFLLNIKSITDPKSTDRKIADLLWFPTGGGKTEAYLGLIAFTMGHKRLRNEIEVEKYGVTVLMRYTLRLLTIQQFQRASTLMCACEYIRRNEIMGTDITDAFGDEPFSIGLWVGQGTTPNKLNQEDREGRYGTGCIQALDYAKDHGGEPPKTHNPIQLLSCPWCGEKLDWRNYLVETQTGTGGARIKQCRIYCNRPACLFSKEKGGKNDGNLPVFVVDEDIYNRCPSLIISTVDKFAQLAWNEDLREIFGRTDRWCEKHGFVTTQYRDGSCQKHNGYGDPENIPKFLHPPELIVQDELHLISGPLGTMVGAYETAIEFLSTNRDGIPPKIVASTATIKKAEDQIRGVFKRDEAFIFPPQGFDFGDSFFATVIDKNDERGKLYVGVCGTAKKGQTIQAKISASMIQKIRSLQEQINKEGFDVKKKLKLIDKYFTFVSYFNSLKELGNASHMYEDSLDGFRDVIYRKFENYDHEKEMEEFKKKNEEGSVEEGEEESSETETEERRKHIKKQNLVKVELTSRKDSKDIPEIIEQLESSIIQSTNPVDILLCTNMLSVGVDIGRLGCMLINGHPKLHSEYIQATGRVGRTFPGLVVSAYNFLKPRDLSHYENFIHYHAQLHKYVEATSVTPFSSRARDRAFFGVVVSMIRQIEVNLSQRADANDFNITEKMTRELTDKIRNVVRERVELIEDSQTAEDTIEYLDKIIEDWNEFANGKKQEVHYHKIRHKTQTADENLNYLMTQNYNENKEWPKFVPNSLREAEPSAGLWYLADKEEREKEEEEMEEINDE